MTGFLAYNDLTKTQREAYHDFLEEHFNATSKSKIVLIHGDSGVGKSALVKIFCESQDFGSLKGLHHIATIDWSSLNDGALESSIANLLYPDATKIDDAVKLIEQWTERTNADQRRNSVNPDEPEFYRPIIVINDVELASQSVAQLETLSSRLLPPLSESKSRPFVILTSIVDFDPGYLEEKGVWELKNPTWEEVGVATDSADSETGGQSNLPNVSALAISLWKRLKSVSRGVAGKSLRDFVERRKIVGTGDKAKDINAVHSALYQALVEEDDSEVGGVALSKLLAWASVDPGFDFWKTGVLNELALGHLNENVQPALEYFFFGIGADGRRPRLVHRSVLDLYSEDWPFRHLKRHLAHESCASVLEDLAPKALEKSKQDRLTIAAIRHSLRMSRYRSWRELARLDAEAFKFPGSAKHELAYARDDFSRGFDSLAEITGERRTRRESRANYWYQPPCRLPRLTSSETSLMEDDDQALLRDTSELMYWDLAYQALDDWKGAREGSKDLYGKRQTPSEFAFVGDLSTRAGRRFELGFGRYWDARCLAAGLYGTMVYEDGKPEDGLEPTKGIYKACRSFAITSEFLRELRGEKRQSPADLRLTRSLESNAFVARMKSRPCRIASESSTQHYDRVLDVLAHKYKALISYANQPLEELIDRAEVLDILRYRVNYARLIFLRGRAYHEEAKEAGPALSAPELAANYLTDRVITLSGGEFDGLDHDLILSSQEWFYAQVQRLYFLLYAGTHTTLKKPDLESIRKNEDGWAHLQLENVQDWHRRLDGEKVSALIENFEKRATKFEGVDSKAQMGCLLAALFLSSKRGALTSEVIIDFLEKGSSPDYMKEDFFYRVCLDHVSGNQRYSELMKRWFPDAEVRETPPIMPGMLILRGIPMSFVPRESI